MHKHLKNVCIEHVGSTAVLQLGGKGIIDIAVGTHSEGLPAVANVLEQLGYQFRENGSTPDRQYFRIDLPDTEQQVRRYHLHLMATTTKAWKQMLAFRDYLRVYPEVAKEYAGIKKKATELSQEDGARYRALKEPFLKKILDAIEPST